MAESLCQLFGIARVAVQKPEMRLGTLALREIQSTANLMLNHNQPIEMIRSGMRHLLMGTIVAIEDMCRRCDTNMEKEVEEILSSVSILGVSNFLQNNGHLSENAESNEVESKYCTSTNSAPKKRRLNQSESLLQKGFLSQNRANLSTICENPEECGETEERTYHAFFDGSSWGNPGLSGAGAVLYDPSGCILDTISVPLGRTTCNVAEYRGLIEALKMATEKGVLSLEVRGDSNLVIRQMRGEYRVKNDNLKLLHTTASELAQKIPKVCFIHVPREENRKADHLALEASRKNPESEK